jgi:4-hydroxybenzoate polyprenyltransferase
MVGSFFRFMVGWFLFSTSIDSLPLIIPFSLILIQASLFIVYKLSSQDSEKKRKVKTTITLLSLQSLQRLSSIVFVIGFGAMIYSFATYLPSFAWLALAAALLPLPLYAHAVFNPTPKGLKSIYQWTYLHLLFCGICFVVIFSFFAV